MNPPILSCPAFVTAGDAVRGLVSADTQDRFLALKSPIQDAIRDKLHAMALIEAGLAEGLNQKDAIRLAARYKREKRGCSVSALTKLFALWSRGGRKPGADGRPKGPIFAPRDWRLFAPDYTNGKPSAALQNEAFVAHVRQLHADTCRDDATGNALHDRLLDAWYAGEEVPGFGTIYQHCAREGRPVPTGPIRRPQDYPQGWSPDNLRRMLPRSRALTDLVRRGEHAAHDHWAVQLLRDRSKLMPLQLITFDDVRFDLRVIMELPGRPPQVVYPEGLFCLDVATGQILAHGFVGSYTRDADGDGGKAGAKRGLQQADMRFLMTQVLETYGLPQDWTMTALLENASASLSEADKRTFSQLTGIRFEATGLVHGALLKSGFAEQGGMPWQKGWIEAYFRALHTRTNHLAGTVGRRYELTAGDRESAARYALKQAVAAHQQGIPLDQLQLPILTNAQFTELLAHYVETLNWRTRHKLQGFSKVFEYELQPGRYIRLDDPRAAALVPVGADLVERMEAPAERRLRLCAGHRFTPPHPTQLAVLALDKRPVTVRSEQVRMVDKQRGGELIYRDEASAEHLLRFNGRKQALIGFLSSDAGCVHLFTNDEAFQYVCSPRRVDRVDMTDEAAMGRALGEVDRYREGVRAEARALQAPQEERLVSMREHNAERLSAADPVSRRICAAEQSHRAAAQKTSDLQQADLDGSDLLGEPAPVAPDLSPADDALDPSAFF